MAQLVERILGKDEVRSSNLRISTISFLSYYLVILLKNLSFIKIQLFLTYLLLIVKKVISSLDLFNNWYYNPTLKSQVVQLPPVLSSE